MATRPRRESLGLTSAMDLLEDVDFESTMMVLEQSEQSGSTPSSGRRRLSSVLRRGSLEQLDLSLTSLAELFPSNADAEGFNFLSTDPINGVSPSRRASTSSDLKIRLPVTSPVIKTEFPHSPTILSPTMDSFLRDSWEDINDIAGKTRRTSSKLLDGLLGHSLLSPTGPESPRRLSQKLPGAATLQQLSTAPRVGVQPLFPTSTLVSAPVTLTARPATTDKPKASKSKQPRRAKQCIEPNCPRRAQSNNRCKTHGGGARCQVEGCDKSSQGGGLCRAHGGGKKCRVSGCTKGTQRLGLCYLHGGIRRCIYEGCKKKDRGNGYCISHGGGRRCEVEGCERSVRKGNHCQTHLDADVNGNASPFKISRGHGLHS